MKPTLLLTLIFCVATLMGCQKRTDSPSAGATLLTPTADQCLVTFTVTGMM